MRKSRILLSSLMLILSLAVGKAESYNRVGVSYNGTQFKNGWAKPSSNDPVNNFFTNGMGVEYTHGFVLPVQNSLLEIGGSFTVGVTDQTSREADTEYRDFYHLKVKNIYLAIPINYVYRVHLSNSVTLSPYIGINVKANLAMRMKRTVGFYNNDGDKVEPHHPWFSCYKESIENPTPAWNRFQAGWQVGVGAQISFMYVGVQYGTDFVPAMHSSNYNVTNGTVKATVAYCF